MKILYTSASFLERFWSHVDVTDGCWNWNLVLVNGYGVVNLGKKGLIIKAHRFSWILANGQDIPEGLFACHHCDNPACVRPDHLFVGTASDNSRDRDRKGRHRSGRIEAFRAQTHCIHGHPFDEANTYRNKDGSRNCKACHAAREREYRRRRREAA
jgi:hypothetical protein